MFHFLGTYWSDIIIITIIFFAVNYRFIPPEMVGYEKEYRDDHTKEMVKQRRQSMLDAITNLAYTLSRTFLVMLTLRGTTSLFIFGVVVFQLIEQHTITTNVVILAAIGLLALHFESIIEQADTVSIWKVFSYKRRS